MLFLRIIYTFHITNKRVLVFKKHSIALKFTVNTQRDDYAMLIFVEHAMDREIYYVNGLLNPIEQLCLLFVNLKFFFW